MRVALCYHGIAKGHNFKNGGLPVGFDHEFDLIKKNLIEHNKDCVFDVFLHSWSLDYKDLVIEKLKPKDSLFEQSKEFKKPSFWLLCKELIKRILGRVYELQRINNIYSRWYSFMKVCDLVKESGQKYDLVIVTRFDMCLLNKFALTELNPNNFYSGDWVTYYNGSEELQEENYENEYHKAIPKGYPFDDEGLQDFFFISSQDYLISKFSRIFNQLNSLLKKYGNSNHLIALGKIKEDNMLKSHKRILIYSKDYFLSRWL